MNGSRWRLWGGVLIAWLMASCAWICCTNKQRPVADNQALARPLSLPADSSVPAAKSVSERPQGIISIAAVGDVMLDGPSGQILEVRGFDYPFDSTRALLQRADIAIANLEAPFTSRGVAFEKTYTFRVPPARVAGLRNAGFDVLNLANNHILDYGEEGLFDTIATLDSLGLLHCGAGADEALAATPALMRVRDKTVAFLGFSTTFPREFWATTTRPGTCFPFAHLMEPAIRESRVRADHVVVSFHWGEELASQPKDYQRLLARKAIDCGADVVLGHHAHVLQGLELYRGRLIAYGLGNFVFCSFSESAKESAILKVYLAPEGPILARVVPICVYNREVAFQPRLLRGQAREAALRRIAELSAPLNGGRQIIDQEGFITFSTRGWPEGVSQSTID